MQLHAAPLPAQDPAGDPKRPGFLLLTAHTPGWGLAEGPEGMPRGRAVCVKTPAPYNDNNDLYPTFETTSAKPPGVGSPLHVRLGGQDVGSPRPTARSGRESATCGASLPLAVPHGHAPVSRLAVAPEASESVPHELR